MKALRWDAEKRQLSWIFNAHTRNMFTELYSRINGKIWLASWYFHHLACSHIDEHAGNHSIYFSIKIEWYWELLVSVERIPDSQYFKLNPRAVENIFPGSDWTTLPTNTWASSGWWLDAISDNSFCNPNVWIELLAKMIDNWLHYVLYEEGKAASKWGIEQVKEQLEWVERIARLETLVVALRSHREYHARLLEKRPCYEELYSSEFLEKFDKLVAENLEIILIICSFILDLYTDFLTIHQWANTVQDTFILEFTEDIKRSKWKEGWERLVEIYNALRSVNLRITIHL